MSTSRDYRTPQFVLDLNLIPDGSIPPAKLQSGISGSLLQDNSVPPAKLQSGIPGSLLQANSVPLSALAPQVRGYLRLLHSAPFAAYPDTSRGLYRLVNAYGVWSVTAGDTVSDNVLIVVPIVLDRSFNLGTAGVVCNSMTTPGNLSIGLYNSSGSLLSSATRTIGGTGLLLTTFNTTTNLEAGTLYYLGFLKTGGIYTLTTVNYLSLEYIRVSGTSVSLVGVMRFSATSLPSSLNELTLTADGGNRAPALLTE